MTDSLPAPKKLTAKQQCFVDTYLVNGFNATQAAITAGYSAKTAGSIGSENLKKPEIRAAIDAYLDEGVMGAKEVLYRLTRHARGDIGDVWDEVQGRVDWDKMRLQKTSDLIKKIKRKTTRVVHRDDPDEDIIEEEIEFHDAQAALIALGKVHGLFVDKGETTVKIVPQKAYASFSPDDWDDPPA